MMFTFKLGSEKNLQIRFWVSEMGKRANWNLRSRENYLNKKESGAVEIWFYDVINCLELRGESSHRTRKNDLNY